MPEVIAESTAPPVTPPVASPPDTPASTPAAAPVTTPAVDDTTTPAPGTGLPPKGRMVPQVRMDQVTREKWEERRAREAAEARNKELEAEVAKLRTPATTPASAPTSGISTTTPSAPALVNEPAAPTSPQAVDRLIDARATQLVAQREFVKQCNDVFDKGEKEVPGFKDGLKGYDVFGGLGKFPTFVQATVKLENGHKILHELGTNLDEAERILSLPVVDQAIELAKLDLKMKNISTAPPVSNVPAPIAPISPQTPSGIPTPDEDGDFESQEHYRQYRGKIFKKR